MSIDGHHTKWRRNIVENYNHLTRAHERYRQTYSQTGRRQTVGRTTTYSERELTFTFAIKLWCENIKIQNTVNELAPWIFHMPLIVARAVKYFMTIDKIQLWGPTLPFLLMPNPRGRVLEYFDWIELPIMF